MLSPLAPDLITRQQQDLDLIHMSMWLTKGSAGSAVGHGTRYFSVTSPLAFSILGQQNHLVTDVLAMEPLYKYVASVFSTESSMASSRSSTPGSAPDISRPWAKLFFSEKVVMVKRRYRGERRCDSVGAVRVSSRRPLRLFIYHPPVAAFCDAVPVTTRLSTRGKDLVRL
jgi:hypothetical protein